MDRGELQVTARAASGLDRLVSRRGLAIVGASPNQHYAMNVLDNMLVSGFPKESIFPVNPRHQEVAGLPCYPDVSDIPAEIGAAAILTREDTVPAALTAAAERGASAALVVAAGYGESGESGARKQAELGQLAEHLGVCLIGPNSLGYLAPPESLAVWAGFRLTTPLRTGPAALAFQSSGMMNLVLSMAMHRSIGLRAAVAVGNEASTDIADAIRWYCEDPDVEVIGAVIEGSTRPRALVASLWEAKNAGKPVLALKLGRSELAVRNAQAHSGRMAGTGAVWDGVFRQCGVVPVRDLDELVTSMALFGARGPLQPADDGRSERVRLGLVTNSGGDCALVSDLAADRGLEVASLSPASEAAVRGALEREDALGNPLDCGNLPRRKPDAFRAAAEAYFADAAVNVAAFRMMLPQRPDEESLAVYECLVSLARQSGKVPVVVSRAAEALDAEWFSAVQDLGAPLLVSYGTALTCISYLDRWLGSRSRDSGTPVAVPEQALTAAPAPWPLTWDQIRGLLDEAAIPAPAGGIAGEPGEAAALAASVGFPVAVKAYSRSLSHKSDLGGVVLSLASPEQVAQACEDMRSRLEPEVALDGFEVQKMIEGAQELILGSYRDPLFGPVVVLGAGGVNTETLRDVVFALPPVPAAYARDLIMGLRIAPLLGGTRGRSAYDVEAAAEAVEKFSRLLVDHDDLQELEINPLAIMPAGEGVVALDARGRRSEPEQGSQG